MDNNDLISDNTNTGTINAPGISVKRWKRIGYAQYENLVDLYFSFRVEQFFPFINEDFHKGTNKYIFIDKMLSINMNVPSYMNSSKYIAYQLTTNKLFIPNGTNND